MNKRKIILSISVFLVIFFLIEMLFPELLFNKILSYLVVGVGFALWIHSFTTNNSAGIFSGSFIFFSGIVFFVNSSFTIWNPSRMIFPALLTSIGLAAFLTFINDKKIYYLISSVIFLMLGFNFFYSRVNLNFLDFLGAIPHLITSIGIFTAILAILLFYIFRKKYRLDEESKDNKLNDYEKKDDFEN